MSLGALSQSKMEEMAFSASPPHTLTCVFLYLQAGCDKEGDRQCQCIKMSCGQQKLHFKPSNDQIIELEVNVNSVDGVVATVAIISTV